MSSVLTQPDKKSGCDKCRLKENPSPSCTCLPRRSKKMQQVLDKASSDTSRLPRRLDRVEGKEYAFKGTRAIWHKKRWHCIHLRSWNRCIECDGPGTCIHKKIRRACKLCGGNQICVHQKQRSFCKECRGNQICVHDRVRGICRPCGGGQICIHSRIRSRCSECKQARAVAVSK